MMHERHLQGASDQIFAECRGLGRFRLHPLFTHIAPYVKLTTESVETRSDSIA